MALDSPLTAPARPKPRSLLPSGWAVPQRFHERLGEAAGRQRHMLEEGHLLLVLHAVPDPGVPEREPRFFWRSPDGSWRSSEAGGNAQGLLALRAHVQSFADEVDGLEEKLQAAHHAADFLEILRTEGPLLRCIRNLHRTLQAAREAMPRERELISLRDRANDLERALDLVHMDARNGLDYLVARRSEEQVETSQRLMVESRRLNLLMATFLPVTALASAFGMNLAHGMEERWAPWAFWGVLIAGIVLGLLVRSTINRSPSAGASFALPPLKAGEDRRR